MTRLAAFLLLCSVAIAAPPTEAELLDLVDGLTARASELEPSAEKDAILTEASQLRTAVLALPDPPPPSNILPGLVEYWEMQEPAGNRAGSLPTTPTINPGRINLVDVGGVGSAAGPGGTTAAVFAGQNQWLQTEWKNSAGNSADDNWHGGVGSFTAVGRVYWDPLPPNNAHLFWTPDWGVKRTYSPVDFTARIAFHTRAARTGVITDLLSSVPLVPQKWYLVAAGWDASTGKAFVVVVDDQGTLARTESGPIGRRAVNSFSRLFIGGGHYDSLAGRMAGASFYKAALTNAEMLALWNGGVPLPFSEVQPAPPPDPGPAPFTNLQLVQADFETTANRGTSGLYWYCPYPLHQWSPTLAATLGNFAWVHSTDHSTGGVWLGFSASPATKPTSWTQIIAGSGTIEGRTYSGLETPYLTYNASDPNGRPFYCYVHAVETSGYPPGLGSSQETYLWSSADMASWVKECVAIPTEGFPPGPAYNHTGYATLFSPGALPGQLDWRAYSLGYDTSGQFYCTPSTNPRLFNIGDDPEELDTASPFGAGYNRIEWFTNVFTDGTHVYGVGRGFFPGGRGACLCELAFENGAWRLPTGKLWELFRDTGTFPSLGYTQDVRCHFDGDKLHIYRYRGFFPQSGDARVDYWTAEF